MKILMFGRGVIATQYGWALERAGHQVEFYVRPGRAAQYGPAVTMDIFDGRKRRAERRVSRSWNHTLRENLEVDHDFDLIILSVHHDRFPEAAAFLAPRMAGATLLIFGNLLTEPREATSGLPSDQVSWGFPGAGGGFAPDGTLHGGLLKPVFLGTMGTGPSIRDVAVRQMFRDAGFSVSTSRDFRSWLLFHFIMDAAMGVAWLRAGDIDALMDSSEHLTDMLVGTKSMLPLLKARGSRIEPAAFRPILWLPPSLVAKLLRRTAFAKDGFARATLKAGAVSQATMAELRVFPRDLLDEARRLGVDLPWLEDAEPLLVS